jgi:hypothetical protein
MIADDTKNLGFNSLKSITTHLYLIKGNKLPLIIENLLFNL